MNKRTIFLLLTAIVLSQSACEQCDDGRIVYEPETCRSEPKPVIRTRCDSQIVDNQCLPAVECEDPTLTCDDCSMETINDVISGLTTKVCRCYCVPINPQIP